jgi:metal-responsive CopG/Arc/MetJ family transcriptional regulator
MFTGAKEGTTMTARFNVVLSDDLNNEIDQVVENTTNSKSEVIRKALQLYLEAQKAKAKGLTLGLIGEDNQVKTKIIGL